MVVVVVVVVWWSSRPHAVYCCMCCIRTSCINKMTKVNISMSHSFCRYGTWESSSSAQLLHWKQVSWILEMLVVFVLHWSVG